MVVDVFNPRLSWLVDAQYLAEGEEEPAFTMPDGRREERLVHRFDMRYFFRFEIEHLLARSGFHMEAMYADYDRSPVWVEIFGGVNRGCEKGLG